MKLIAFDIDGTSINRYRNVSHLSIKTLKTMHDAGYILVPTTGRCLNEIPKAILDLGICEYAITSNGAKIIDLRNNVTLYEKSLTKHDVISLLNVVDLKKWMISFHKENEVYDTHNLLRYARRVLFHKDFKVRPKINNIELFLEDTEKIEKIQLTTRSRQDMDCFVKRVKTDFDFEMPISRGRYIEITQASVNKLSGVQNLLDILNIDISEVFSIGDDMNDLELIKASGVGVAMGNANDLVKSHANFITDTNQYEGFFKAIKKYFPENITF